MGRPPRGICPWSAGRRMVRADLAGVIANLPRGLATPPTPRPCGCRLGRGVAAPDRVLQVGDHSSPLPLQPVRSPLLLSACCCPCGPSDACWFFRLCEGAYPPRVLFCRLGFRRGCRGARAGLSLPMSASVKALAGWGRRCGPTSGWWLRRCCCIRQDMPLPFFKRGYRRCPSVGRDFRERSVLVGCP